MFVTRYHAKHVLNYEYLTAARILHSVLALENGEVIKYSAKYFLHFRNVLLNLCNNSEQT